MPLTPGTRLGLYEIVAAIGTGGMGEVYRARDTKLKRDVALKVLPAAFTADPDRLGRFYREAEVLASLDHPNIGPIYGMVESDGMRGLALALIEGPTLADRIAAGPLPGDEALTIAKQIIEALEYAHERNVIHRDLKPANIKVTAEGMVKVLDFGLAKVLDDETPAPAGIDSPTLTLGHTRPGMILGTAAYMSPEQAIGKSADRRSDIFSFGSVLFEMLTGQRAFKGETAGETLVSVAKDDPDWSKLPASLPSALQKLLRRCLVKDRKKRLQAIGEARLILEDLKAGGESSVLPPRAAIVRYKTLVVAWILTGILALASAGLGYLALEHVREEPARAVIMSVLPAEKSNAGTFSPPAVSPDGRRVAFVGTVNGVAAVSAIWVRYLDALTPRLLPGTEGAIFPFWSPDSSNVAFFADGKLKKIDVTGGPAVTVCDAPGRGGTWSSRGVIVFAPNGFSGLQRVLSGA